MKYVKQRISMPSGNTLNMAPNKGVLCTLLARCRLELHDQFSGYPAAILHFNALGLGPLAYAGGVQPACRSPARTAGRRRGSADRGRFAGRSHGGLTPAT